MTTLPTDDLRARLHEANASRARLVAAADDERQRIEAALHDGVQQQLVALLVNLQLARQVLQDDPAAAVGVLHELSRDAREALDDLRVLALRIYPPLLTSCGLAEALLGAAAVSSIPVSVDVRVGRHPAAIEATAYFFCVEAVDNAARYGGAGVRAQVRVHVDGGTLVIEVSDDGAGFEPTATARGGGLTAMDDRLLVYGGRLTVWSRPGEGTRVVGTIPLEP